MLPPQSYGDHGQYQRRIRPKRASFRDRHCMAKLQKYLPGPKGRPAQLSSGFLSTLTGVAPNHARMHMLRLEHLGLIECVKPCRQGSPDPGLYLLTAKGLEFDPGL